MAARPGCFVRLGRFERRGSCAAACGTAVWSPPGASGPRGLRHWGLCLRGPPCDRELGGAGPGAPSCRTRRALGTAPSPTTPDEASSVLLLSLQLSTPLCPTAPGQQALPPAAVVRACARDPLQQCMLIPQRAACPVGGSRAVCIPVLSTCPLGLPSMTETTGRYLDGVGALMGTVFPCPLSLLGAGSPCPLPASCLQQQVQTAVP